MVTSSSSTTPGTSEGCATPGKGAFAAASARPRSSTERGIRFQYTLAIRQAGPRSGRNSGSAARSYARIATRCAWMWSGCPYPPFSSYVTSTCGRTSRTTATRYPAASSRSARQKQPGTSFSGTPIMPESR